MPEDVLPCDGGGECAARMGGISSHVSLEMVGFSWHISLDMGHHSRTSPNIWVTVDLLGTCLS